MLVPCGRHDRGSDGCPTDERVSRAGLLAARPAGSTTRAPAILLIRLDSIRSRGSIPTNGTAQVGCGWIVDPGGHPTARSHALSARPPRRGLQGVLDVVAPTRAHTSQLLVGLKGGALAVLHGAGSSGCGVRGGMARTRSGGRTMRLDYRARRLSLRVRPLGRRLVGRAGARRAEGCGRGRRPGAGL